MLSWQRNLIESCTCMMTPRHRMRSTLFRPAHSSSLLPAQPSYNALQHRHPKSSAAWLAAIQVSSSKRLNIPRCVMSQRSNTEQSNWPNTQLITASCSAVLSRTAAKVLTPDRLMNPCHERNCGLARSRTAAALTCGGVGPQVMWGLRGGHRAGD